MKAIWVYDDFGGQISRRDLVMLLASAKLWSIHCPNDTRVLYCSRSVGNAIVSSGIPKVFHKRISLSSLPTYNVDTSIFWSFPKLRVLSQIDEPIVLIDHDFMTFKSIWDYLNPDRLCYNYTEDARQYYPTNVDSLIKQLSYRTRWPEESANVSFLYLPDPAFTKFYAGTSIQIMEELSALKAPNAKYLIFAEQMVLKHLVGEDYQCLTKEIYECKRERFSEDREDPRGIWSFFDIEMPFEHYGPVKKRWTPKEYRDILENLCKVAELPVTILNKRR